jgi:hypothetical protein
MALACSEPRVMLLHYRYFARSAKPCQMSMGARAGAQRRPFASPETGQKGSRGSVSIATCYSLASDRSRGTDCFRRGGPLSLARRIEARRAETRRSPLRNRLGSARESWTPPSACRAAGTCHTPLTNAGRNRPIEHGDGDDVDRTGRAEPEFGTWHTTIAEDIPSRSGKSAGRR